MRTFAPTGTTHSDLSSISGSNPNIIHNQRMAFGTWCTQGGAQVLCIARASISRGGQSRSYYMRAMDILLA